MASGFAELNRLPVAPSRVMQTKNGPVEISYGPGVSVPGAGPLVPPTAAQNIAPVGSVVRGPALPASPITPPEPVMYSPTAPSPGFSKLDAALFKAMNTSGVDRNQLAANVAQNPSVQANFDKGTVQEMQRITRNSPIPDTPASVPAAPSTPALLPVVPGAPSTAQEAVTGAVGGAPVQPGTNAPAVGSAPLENSYAPSMRDSFKERWQDTYVTPVVDAVRSVSEPDYTGPVARPAEDVTGKGGLYKPPTSVADRVANQQDDIVIPGTANIMTGTEQLTADPTTGVVKPVPVEIANAVEPLLAQEPNAPKAPAANTPDSKPVNPWQPVEGTDFNRMIVPIAGTDKERVFYQNGKGSWMIGDRAAGSGLGNISFLNRKAADNLSERSYNRDHPNQGGGNAGAAPAMPMYPQRPEYKTPWNDALQDYAAGRVGSEGYRKISNFVGRTTRFEKGKEVPDIAGLVRLKQVTGLAAQELQQGKGGGDKNTGLDYQRFLLDQQKFAHTQNKDAEAAKRDKDKNDLEYSKYKDEARKNFIQNGIGYGDGAPADRLNGMAWNIAEETGIPPDRVAYALKAQLNGNGYEGGDLTEEEIAAAKERTIASLKPSE